MYSIFHVFTSISGEVGGFPQGSLAFFIRFAGCNLRCSYCDIPASREPKNGRMTTLSELYDLLCRSNCQNVMITGGEPLMQQDSLSELCYFLLKKDFSVSVETNGTISVPDWSVAGRRPIWVIDYKLPSSGMMDDENLYAAQINVTKKDWLKFVIFTEADFDIAADTVFKVKEKGHPIDRDIQIAFSPGFSANGKNNFPLWKNKFFSSAILKKHGVVLNLQVHKILGLD